MLELKKENGAGTFSRVLMNFSMHSEDLFYATKIYFITEVLSAIVIATTA